MSTPVAVKPSSPLGSQNGHRPRRSSLPPAVSIEWTPSWVRAIDTVSGKSAEGTNLGELGSVISGHRQALVGVGRSAVFLKAVRLPKAQPADLRRIIGVQIGQLFPLPPSDLSFDFFQTADTTADGCLTVVAGMRADDLRQLRYELRQAGITPARVLPAALAAPAIAQSAGTSTALVAEHIPNGLALDVVQDGVIRLSRVAPRTANPEVEARRTLAAARLETAPFVAVGDVELPDALPGFGSSLSHLAEAPPFHFELAEDIARVENKRVTDYATRSILIFLLAVVIAGYFALARYDAVKAANQDRAKWARQMAHLKSEEEGDTNQASTIIAAGNAIDKAFRPAQPISDISAVISDSLPPGAWLTGINVERGKPIQIRGTARTADDVAKAVKKLGTNPRLRDVRLVFANSGTIGQAPVVQFNISAFAVGNVPMPAPPKSATGVATTSSGTSIIQSDVGAQQ